MRILKVHDSHSQEELKSKIRLVKGYNYQGVQHISYKIDFVDSHYLDTISSSNNFTISYIGYENNELISVDIFPASAENYIFLNMTSSPINSQYSFEVPDNGTLVIPSSIWLNLPKNIYYKIAITNYKQSSEQFEGFNIIKKSIFTLATEIYLIQ